MLGTLAPDEIEELLSTEAVGRIGCIHEGRPYVVPVCYVYQDGAVYGHTTEGMKWQAMRAHPDVCFEVEHVDTLNDWRSVIAWGRVEELDGADAEHGLRLLIDRLMPLLRPVGPAQRRPRTALRDMPRCIASGSARRPDGTKARMPVPPPRRDFGR
ncbi:pyridoxamine 5'-phosphate oxidase family protein [Mycolicibacterium elephantis]|uniref:pyridoxamine 5'-phosphate oxidase family protein n=1 Tax=Mycolicibacterium elephantis TaxID=81858 RepID=UPI0019D4D765|nr:pyridoxamine 5'-phosphate oxidase family protein [Mycolicibacterium elephantis]